MGAYGDCEPEDLGICPRCEDETVELTPGPQPNMMRHECRVCGWKSSWLKMPWTAARAENFVMPYGCNKGKRIGDLAKTVRGRDYLRWLAANVEKGPGIAASIALGLKMPGAVERR